MQYPRVTEVLNVISWYPDKQIPDFILNKLASYGTGLHNVIAKASTGQRTRVQRKYKARVDNLQQFMEEEGYIVESAECPVKYEFNHGMEQRGFVGTCDAVVKAPDGLLELWDYKSGKFNLRHMLQVNGYKLGYEFSNPGKIISRLKLIRPTKDGVSIKEVPDLASDFLNLLDWYYKVNDKG